MSQSGNSGIGRIYIKVGSDIIDLTGTAKEVQEDWLKIKDEDSWEGKLLGSPIIARAINLQFWASIEISPTVVSKMTGVAHRIQKYVDMWYIPSTKSHEN